MDTKAAEQQPAPAAQAGGRRPPSVRELVAYMAGMHLALGYDELANETVKTGPLPWDGDCRQRTWAQLDDAELYALLQDDIGLRSEKDLDRATVIYARRRSCNPLIDLIDTIEWDGTERAGTLLVTYLGAEDSVYVRTVENVFLCGALRRAREPGCKFDLMPVLTGPGGIGKSTFARRLALRDRYFTDSVYDLGNVKTTGEVLRGKWIVELSELGGIKGRSLEAVKAGITRQTDTFRVAYGKRSTDFPRRSVFIGTTNTVGFIAEKSSGARRFLPVLCGTAPAPKSVHSEEFANDVRQVWAEVREWMRTGDPRFSLTLSPEMELEVARQREGFLEEDPRVDVINAYLDANRDHLVCTREIADCALRMEPTSKLFRDVSDTLSNQCPGWHYAGKRQCGGYGKQRSWEYRGA